MHVTHTHKQTLRAKEIGVVHGHAEKSFQYILVLNQISVDESLLVPLHKTLDQTSTCFKQMCTLLHIEKYDNYAQIQQRFGKMR